MKVKLIKDWAGFKSGDTVELVVRVAAIWINKGVAEKFVNKPSFNKKKAPKNTK